MKNILKQNQDDIIFRLNHLVGYPIKGTDKHMYRDFHGNLLIGVPDENGCLFVDTMKILSFNLG